MTGKKHVELATFDFAPELQPREIAVGSLFTAVSPGTECANYLAIDLDTLRPGSWCAYPWTPGYAGVGEVLDVGSDVREYKVGDRIVGNLPHASHSVMSANEVVAPADPSLNPHHSAYTRIGNIAYTPLQALRLEPFAVAGVWGQGLIGNLTAQFLNAAGYRTVGIDPVAGRRTLSEECGITSTLDPTASDFEDRLSDFTGRRGLDVAVDTTGHAPTTVGMPGFIRIRGQMVLLTHWRNQAVVDASPFISHLFTKGITLIGSHEWPVGSEPFHDWMAQQRHKMAVIQQQMRTNILQIAPLISHVVKPTQCRETYDGLCFDKDHWRGVVVDWQS